MKLYKLEWIKCPQYSILREYKKVLTILAFWQFGMIKQSSEYYKVVITFSIRPLNDPTWCPNDCYDFQIVLNDFWMVVISSLLPNKLAEAALITVTKWIQLTDWK